MVRSLRFLFIFCCRLDLVGLLPHTALIYLPVIFVGILPQIMEQRAKHGMDWSVRTKEAFQKSIIKSRKNFASVAREVNRPISECQDYYYGTFKLMSEYSKLKEALKQDVQNETTIQQLNRCAQCNECGKEMISCAICEMYFHFTCCKYPPKGADVWFCNDCDPQD